MSGFQHQAQRAALRAGVHELHPAAVHFHDTACDVQAQPVALAHAGVMASRASLEHPGLKLMIEARAGILHLDHQRQRLIPVQQANDHA